MTGKEEGAQIRSGVEENCSEAEVRKPLQGQGERNPSLSYLLNKQPLVDPKFF